MRVFHASLSALGTALLALSAVWLVWSGGSLIRRPATFRRGMCRLLSGLAACAALAPASRPFLRALRALVAGGRAEWVFVLAALQAYALLAYGIVGAVRREIRGRATLLHDRAAIEYGLLLSVLGAVELCLMVALMLR